MNNNNRYKMNNIVIDCKYYKKKNNKLKEQITKYRNENDIYIAKTPLKIEDFGKKYYQKPYRYNTKKRIFPFLRIREEHDYMWFSR